jgi:ketopantoate reductase
LIDEPHPSPVFKTCEEAAQSGPFDYVLCASKALLDAKPSLEDQIRPVVSANTSIVILQNGVGAEAPLHEAFPGNTVISAVVWTGGRILDNGVVQQFNREGLTIGVDWKTGESEEERRKEQERLDVLVGLLRAGGGDCTVVDDIQSERWVKVIW